MRRCSHCQKEIDQTLVLTPDVSCPHCSKSLWTCMNCHYYAPSAQFACLQEKETPQMDKKSANNCKLFSFREVEQQKKIGIQETAKKKIDDLFSNL